MKKIVYSLLLPFFMIISAYGQNVSISVEVKEAGTLLKQLTKSGVDIYDLKRLKIAGPLNGDDIITIRSICGTTSYTKGYQPYFKSTVGKLEYLDLRNATIVAGGDCYFYYFSSRPDYGGSDHYEYYTNDDCMSNAMFVNCTNLKEVIMPESLKEYEGLEYRGGSIPRDIKLVFGKNIENVRGVFTDTCVPYFYCTTPPFIGSNLYNYRYQGWAYIISDYLDAFKSDDNWKYAKFVPMESQITLSDFYSDNHDDNSVSQKSLSVFIPASSTLSFDYNVSSETDCDFLKVTLNGKTLINKSGEQSGTYTGTFNSDIEGELVITYTKDVFASDGTDNSSVTNITLSIPSVNGLHDIYNTIPSETYIFDDRSEILTNSRMFAETLIYKRSFSNTEWQSLYVPFSINYEDWSDNFEVAMINDFHQYDTNNDGIFDLMEMEFIRVKNGSLLPNHPYLIKAKNIGNNEIIVHNAEIEEATNTTLYCSSMNTSFTFTGTTTPISGTEMLNGGYYAVGNGTLHQAEDESNSLKSYRWYLNMESRMGQQSASYPNEVKIKVWGSDEESETSINTILDASHQNILFDMNGRAVQNNHIKSYIYIHNGKKIIAK